MASSNILTQPFHPPPPGVVPDYSDHPQTRGRDMMITSSVFLGVMIVFVSIRAYTKLWLMRRPTWDDLTCLIGFLLTVTYYAVYIRDVSSGYVGYQSWDVTIGQVAASDFYVLAYVQELINPLALGFIKLSFFILYFHIFNPIPRMRTTTWINATICGIFSVLIFVLNMYFSTPRQGETFVTHFCNPVFKGGVHLSVPFAAIGLIFDLVIITIPIYGVYQLQLSGRQKLSVSVMFLTGGFACVSAMLTLNYRIALRTTDDPLTVLVPNLTTSLVEMMIGVICTCAPSFSRIVQEHPSSFETLKPRLQSSFRPIGRFISIDSTKSSLGYGRRDRKGYRGDHVSDQERLTRGRIADDRGYELREGSSFQAFVEEGPGGFASENGIRVESEILQGWVAGDDVYRGDRRKSPPFTAAEMV